MTNLNDSTVQITYGELKKLETALAEARYEIKALKEQPAAPESELLTQLTASERRYRLALDAALDALGVYTARVSPYEVKGLPAAKLRWLVGALKLLDGHVDTIDTLLELVNEIDACEEKRAANPKPVHVATGEDWQAGREAFEREFGVDPSTYRDGGLAGVVRARAAKEAVRASQPTAETPTTISQPSDDIEKA